jgi:hypothetical protein
MWDKLSPEGEGMLKAHVDTAKIRAELYCLLCLPGGGSRTPSINSSRISRVGVDIEETGHYDQK